MSPIVPPKIKKNYKYKEKLVEKPSMVPFVPPLWKENKPMVDKPIPTQSQFETMQK